VVGSFCLFNSDFYKQCVLTIGKQRNLHPKNLDLVAETVKTLNKII
jgi:hypothetical protein